MSEEHLLVERRGHVLVLRMNRPEAKNAFSPNMLVRMADAWDTADSDDDIRCVVLTGSAEVFCAGADLKAMGADPAPDDVHAKRFKSDAGMAWKALLRHHRLTKPLIAAVEGPAMRASHHAISSRREGGDSISTTGAAAGGAGESSEGSDCCSVRFSRSTSRAAHGSREPLTEDRITQTLAPRSSTVRTGSASGARSKARRISDDFRPRS